MRPREAEQIELARVDRELLDRLRAALPAVERWAARASGGAEDEEARAGSNVARWLVAAVREASEGPPPHAGSVVLWRLRGSIALRRAASVGAGNFAEAVALGARLREASELGRAVEREESVTGRGRDGW